MRIPGAVKLYKEALTLTFPGLAISNDLSNRSSDHTVSASTSWSIWYDPATGQNLRSSAADGLLWPPEQQRESLTVLSNHKVDKVIFQDDLMATGVTFGVKPGTPVPGSLPGLHTVHAAKEVILAAGSLATAPVLERSGIGNSSILRGAGIAQIVDLPGVGCNLVDQPGTGSAALVAESYHNDTAIIDNISLFAPELSVVNVDQIWGTYASSIYAELVSPESLESRALALVVAGAAATAEGAKSILNVTTDLIVNHQCELGSYLVNVHGD